MKFLKKIVHLGLDEPPANDIHTFKIKVSNVVAIVAFTIFYFPQLTFHLKDEPPSMLSFLSTLGLFVCCVLILYFNYQKKHQAAKYVLTIGFSISLLLTNLFYPTAKDLLVPYILVGLACGGLFESNRGKLISLSACLLCLGVSVLHSLEVFSFASVISTAPVYTPSDNLVLYRYIIVACVSFYVMHLAISSAIRNERQLKGQLIKIENLESQRKNHFSNTAHEFKTPLTLITGHVDYLLKNYGHENEVRKSLQNIKKNAHHLIGFTEQILDLLKLDNSKVPVNIVQFHLNELISEALASFDVTAINRKVDFQKPVFVPGTKIVSDAQKLLIVLNNLLSNAFKYTPANGSITVNVLELEDSVQLIIQDSGRGIKEEDLDRIFEPYFQTSAVDAPLLGGTGIGLAICKEYLKLLGGSIEVQSKLGLGSSFIVTFLKRMSVENQSVIMPYNFDKSAAPQAMPLQPRIPHVTEKAERILIVEDNLELCDFLKTILERQFNLDFVHNGEDALAFLKDKRPGLIISDIMMPVMDGMELLARLKGDDELRGIPVLMLTAKSDSSAQSKALRIGVDDYLLKPFDAELLTVHINSLLKLAGKRTNNKYLRGEPGVPGEEAKVGLPPQKVAESDNAADEPVQAHPAIMSAKDQRWLSQFEEIVAGSVTDINLDLSKVASGMAISKAHLNRKVNAILGISPKRYIMEVRLSKAKKMLENRDYNSVKAVAYSVGFKSEKVFSRNFKSRFGRYPSEYLK